MSPAQHPDASTSYRRALDAFQRGDFSDALDRCEALLARQPTHRDGLILRANLAIRADDPDAGIDALSRLIAAHGAHGAWLRQLSRLFNRRGARHRTSGATGNARDDLRQALRMDDSNTDAWFNLALCERDAGNDAAAAAAVGELLKRRSDDQGGRLLAAKLLAARNPAAAIEQLARLEDADAAAEVLSMAAELDRAGDPTARAVFGEALRLCGGKRPSPMLRAELGQALALPAVVADAGQMAAAREHFQRGLTELEQRWDESYLRRCEASLEQLIWCNFKLAYQGRNDLTPQSRYGDLLQRPLRQWFPDWLEAPTVHSGSQPRIGLLSSCWRDCTAGHYFGGWIDWLTAAGCEVRLYQLGPSHDAHTRMLARKATRFHFHDGDLASLVQHVRDDRLNLLIYPELGMDARLLPLAGLRLARRQAAAWGHPVTSGLQSIDVFFSCAEMEPEDAASHYRERLLPLPGLGVNYGLPDISAGRSPALPEGPRVLLPHSLFKLHPDNDAVIAALAAKRPDIRFLLFRERVTGWNRQLAMRLHIAFSAHGLDSSEHLHWLPMLSRSDYLAVNRNADLMLDALHWSGGNTSLDALASGLPIMTSEGRFMRGRQTAAMLRSLSLDDWIRPAERIAEAAAQRLDDPDGLADTRRRIIEGRGLLFNSNRASETFLHHVHRLATDA